MNDAIALWSAIIGCYLSIIGICGFVLTAYRNLGNHTATKLDGFGKKLDEVAEDVAYIKGRLDRG